LKTLEEIKAAIEAAVPGASVSVIPNGSPSGQQSLLLDAEHAFAVASFLRDDEELALDYLSNVTGVDWLDKETSEKVKVTRQVPKEMDGPEGK
jgi:NADH-quinone oxidoreductase subunit C